MESSIEDLSKLAIMKHDQKNLKSLKLGLRLIDSLLSCSWYRGNYLIVQRFYMGHLTMKTKFICVHLPIHKKRHPKSEHNDIKYYIHTLPKHAGADHQ